MHLARFIALSLVLDFGLFHCAHQYRADEMSVSVNRAREIVKSSGRVAQADLAYVEKNQPKCAMYILSGNYAQYGFTWTLEDKQIFVNGQGDRFTLDGAKLTIKIKDSRTP